ncbi:cupin domain-containing protein [Spirillospora sp. NPDC052269]
MESDEQPNTVISVLQEEVPDIPDAPRVMTVLIELPPGTPGSPPHRHPGPVFGYMIEGEMLFEVEGEPERVIRAGESLQEAGGDLIHYQAANNLTDRWSRFVVFMLVPQGEPFFTLVDQDELDRRQHLRAPRP